MRVLLIYFSQARYLLPAPPIGLSHVASAARDAGHEVRLLDLLHSRRPRVDLLRALEDFRPDVVGISVRQLDNLARQRLEWHLDGLAEHLATIRSASSATKIVLGGPAITVLGRAALVHLDADYAVVGEGEESFPKLLAALENGTCPGGVPGVCYRADDEIRAVPFSRLSGFGPSRMEDWIDWRPYEKKGGTWAIQTTRGCPLDCIYCPFPGIEGNAVRARPAEEIVDEIERVARTQRPRTFEIADSNFNVPLEPALEFCEEIVRRGLDVRLSAMSFNPATACKELVDLMERAGFETLTVTAEAGNDAMLDSLRKGFDLAQLMKTVDLLRASKLHTLWFLMLGGPGETAETVEASLAFAEKELAWRRCFVVVTTGIRVLPGTELAERAVREGVVPPEEDLTRPYFYLSPLVSEGEILERIDRAVNVNPCIVHAAEGGETLPMRLFHRGLSTVGVPPPYWRFLPAFLRLPPLRFLRKLRPFGSTARAELEAAAAE